MKVNVLTLYPEMFPGPLAYSLAKKAYDEGKWSLNVKNIRSYATDNYQTVDDVPFGGGAGMVMKVDVLDRCLSENHSGKIIYFSPRGKKLNQEMVENLVKEPELTCICGRFEGIDERIFSLYDIEEISIGDFVLSGGEVACITMLDALIRYLPNVLGNPESLKEESFVNGLLEYPLYTRPAEYKGLKVPSVLLSGHHQKIKDWQKEQSLLLTKERRPDLWDAYIRKEKK